VDLFMDIAVALHSIKQFPPVERLRRERARKLFLSDMGYGAHSGVFRSFEEARKTLPPSREFDTASLADEYVKVRANRVFPYDYPVMWWLTSAFEEGASRVYDIGGSVGVHYLAYKRYLQYPRDLHWLVSEVPAMVEIGRGVCARRGESAAVHFTDRLEPEAVEADVWICAGALHYIEEATGMDALLRRARKLPSRIVLNKLPLHVGRAFVSTQNIGDGAFAPHHVYNIDQFIRGVEAFGYQVRDSWRVPERQFQLFGDTENSFGAYTGIAFELKT
jgi:putative methyltransferase (TIGR04325 family)